MKDSREVFDGSPFDKLSLFRTTYIQDNKFYAYVLQTLDAPFHYKIDVKPKPSF
jgi:hypothetical protein